jgi:hypothetical protein
MSQKIVALPPAGEASYDPPLVQAGLPNPGNGWRNPRQSGRLAQVTPAGSSWARWTAEHALDRRVIPSGDGSLARTLPLVPANWSVDEGRRVKSPAGRLAQADEGDVIVIPGGGAPGLPSRHAMSPDEQSDLLEWLSLGQAGKIMNFVEAKIHDSMYGLDLANLAGYTRNPLLARGAVLVHAGLSGSNAAGTLELLKQMNPKYAAGFAEALAGKIAIGGYKPRPDIKAALDSFPSAISVLEALRAGGATEEAAGQFAEAVIIGGGLPEGLSKHDPKALKELDILTGALAGGWYPGNLEIQRQVAARLVALALEPAGQKLFEKPEYRREMLGLMKSPVITAAKLREEITNNPLLRYNPVLRNNPWLTPAVVELRLQEAMRSWVASGDGAFEAYDRSSRLSLKIEQIKDAPQSAWRIKFPAKDTDVIEKAIRNASRDIGGSWDNPEMGIVPIYVSHANGSQVRQLALFVVRHGGQERVVDLAGKPSTFKEWRDNWNRSFMNVATFAPANPRLITYPKDGRAVADKQGWFALESQ